MIVIAKIAGNVVPFRKGAERHPAKPVKRDIVASLRRADLVRLWSQRDEAGGPPGRDVELDRLQFLLELGLTGIEAPKRTPWLEDGELERLIAAANANGAFWSGDATHTIAGKIGERVDLTFDEFRACGGFKYIAPCDAQPYEVREFWEARRRERDAERKRRRRAADKKDRTSRTDRWSPRERAVLAFVRANETKEAYRIGESTEEISARVRTSPAFRSRLGRLSESSSLRTVRRVVPS